MSMASPSGQVFNTDTAGTAGPAVTVLDSDFHPVTLPGSFAAPSLPAGYTVFNTQILNGRLYVAYPNFVTNSGAVAEFDLNGNFVSQVAIGTNPDQPWASTSPRPASADTPTTSSSATSAMVGSTSTTPTQTPSSASSTARTDNPSPMSGSGR